MLHTTGETIVNNAPYVAAGGTVIAGIALVDWAVYIGIGFVVLTYITNLYFHLKRNKRNK